MRKLKWINYLLAGIAVICAIIAVLMLVKNNRVEEPDQKNEETRPEIIYHTKYTSENPALHISHELPGEQQTNPVYADGSTLYSRIKFTGSALPEEQIYNVRELEQLFEFNEKFNLFLEEENGDDTYTGMHFLNFLTLAGLAEDASDDTTLDFYAGEKLVYSISLKELKDASAIPLLVFGKNGLPLVPKKDSVGYESVADNRHGPMAFLLEKENQQQWVSNVTKVLVSNPGQTEDPHYGDHNRGPYLAMAGNILTVRVYDGEDVTEYSFTAEELEKMEQDHPEAVSGGYYATNGNLESLTKYGDIGGFMDYYEGLRLSWLLSEQCGISEDMSGSAEFLDRHSEWIASVEEIRYFWGKNEEYQDYYTISRDCCVITNQVPILGITKNGYPQLWEHDHEAEGAVKYNQLNGKLYDAGFDTEIGIVQNVSGPFTICLPNCDGSYGGYQITTGGSCSEINIYLVE